MRARCILLLGFLSGCATDFIEEWEVTKPRLMLAKVVIDGDEEGRSRPRPGETFSIEMYLMSPERPQGSYSGDLATCVGTLLPNGTLACAAEESFAEITPLPYEGNDRFVISGFSVPPFLDELPPPLDTLERVSLFGSLCVDGQVERVPNSDAANDPVSTLYRCVDNDESPYKTQLPFTMSVWLDRDTPEGSNHHPSFACDSNEETGACHEGVAYEGEQVPGSIVMRLPEKVAGKGERTVAWEPWDPSEELPWDNCAEGPESLPRVHVDDGEYEIFVRFDASDRETYERKIKVNDKYEYETRREELVLTHAITTRGGSLDGATSVLRAERSDSEAQAALKYTPPPKPGKKAKPKDAVPEEGRLVRFYFGVRDQRGGVDFTTRELCLLPLAEDASND